MQTLFSIFISLVCCCLMDHDKEAAEPKKEQIMEKVEIAQNSLPEEKNCKQLNQRTR